MHKVRTLQESCRLEKKTDPMIGDHKMSNMSQQINTQMIGPEPTNQEESPMQLDESHTTGDLETIQQLEADLMTNSKTNLETNPESPFTLVTKGVPSRAIAQSTMGFTAPNIFELLQD